MEDTQPYYAEGTAVFKRPVKNGTSMTMGFKVCEVSEYLSEDAAKLIAFALNEHHEKHA